MKNATGIEIEEEMRSLLAAFESLSSETNTNAAVITMIASGLLTVGQDMREAYQTVAWGGSLPTWLGEVIVAAGGVLAVTPVAVGIIATLAHLFVSLKE